MIKSTFTGEAVIFKNEKGFYSTSFSRKKQDNTYENAYMPVQFRKDVVLENKQKINIKEGFLTFRNYTTKDGKNATGWYLFISDFATEEQAPTAKNDGIIASNEDDLPF